ncbi:MAG: glycoside hydrolase family 28 protein [Clostridia bacterium]|nr:glycoside hydrolase family 28 protein [Clostridia bacterium]
MKKLFCSSRSVTVLLDPEGAYEAREPHSLVLNGKELGEEKRSVCSLFGLWPDTEYRLESRCGNRTEKLVFRTQEETCSLDVRRFGAKGDGKSDDTAMLQAAILSCPAGGRVFLPRGDYLTGPLFLKSDMTLELKEGARLRLLTDRERFPILPGVTRTTDEQGEVILGLFEGNPLDCFAGALNGIGIRNTAVIGAGVVDGQADKGDWWIDHKKVKGAFRGNLFFLQRCENITVQGVTFENSPCWNLHPAFSTGLDFLNVRVKAPYHSPNTDGFDPESCSRVRLLGAEFSVGDDCIAIKSGKIYLGSRYHIPCEDIEIAWCAMLDGHGGVTLGSEMAGGIRNVQVHHCYMRGNDRGLRVKTRRGRGKHGVVDGITFRDVAMDGVKAPLVINSFYHCDPDGSTQWVQSREKQPVDDTTPTIGSITFERVRATGCKASAAYALGLPERPVGHLVMKDCAFSFLGEEEPMQPAMAEGVESVSRRGLILRWVGEAEFENVTLDGIEGEAVDALDCGSVVIREGTDDIHKQEAVNPAK